MIKTIAIAQGGGPTAVINQSLVGAIQEARRQNPDVRILGARHGVRGLLDRDFLDLSAEPDDILERVAATPSSALGSTRDKPDAAYCAGIAAAFRAENIDAFFYCGGNDSSDTVRIVSEDAQKNGHALAAFHIPKTVDNDLMENDHTPGFGSAARFVTQAFSGLNLDNAALQGAYIAVIMGRHAGFLTAATSLAREHSDDGPHIICLPERAFDEAAFLQQVRSIYDRLGRCMIAVSEGIADANHTPIAESLMDNVETDAHGNVSLSGTGALGDALSGLIKSKLGISRVRADTFGYLQRSFAGCVSDTDAAEARQVGIFAVKSAFAGEKSASVAIVRTGDYSVDYKLVPLAAVAAKTRLMPDEFIARGGFDVTPAFDAYCRPLIGTNLPAMARLGQ